MASGLRKFVLAVHLTSSLGWVGVVLAYIALGVTARQAWMFRRSAERGSRWS
jgi:hypothetical protein